MENSNAVSILIQIASYEAANMSAMEVDVEHIFLATLKLRNISKNERYSLEILPSDWEAAESEISSLRIYLSGILKNNIGSHQFKRMILQNPFEKGDFSGKLSDRSKILFDYAVTWAKNNKNSLITLSSILSGTLSVESPVIDRFLNELNISRDLLLSGIEVSPPDVPGKEDNQVIFPPEQIYSNGIMLIHMIASLEAANLSSKVIECEHILLGFLKLEDYVDKQLILGDEKLDNFLSSPETNEILHYWRSRNISCKKARRKLRELLGKENYEKGDFSGHRSPRCREMFDRANELAVKKNQSQVDMISLLAAAINSDYPIISKLFLDEGIYENLVPGKDDSPLKPELGNQKIGDSGKEAEKIHEANKEVRNEKKKPEKDLLDKYGRDITLLAREGKLPPVIGRKGEIKQIARILNQSMRNNPILLGDAGVGKTAIVEGLAQRIVAPGAPPAISHFQIVEISIGALVAGAMYRGQFEERLMEIIKAAKADPNMVLFIDEIHTMMGAGAVGGGNLDAANILKPALSRGEIRCIGATTIDEYRKYIEIDAAMARRFQQVWVEQSTPEETISILMGIRERLENHHQISIPDVIINRLVSLTDRYITEGNFPDKAIIVLDEACSSCKLASISRLVDTPSPAFILSLKDISEVIARKTGIPMEVIESSDEERILEIDAFLKQRVMGQDKAIASMSRLIRGKRVGLQPEGRPIVVLFAGPTGTGKTELAKSLAEFLFHDEQRLIRLDMSEFQEEHTVAKIIGSPPGYVGFGEEPYIIREIRQHPYSIILLDEIEKAHPKVLSIFLQIFDEGRLTDARGRLIQFKNAMIIMTSNLGAGKVHIPVGFAVGKDPQRTRDQEKDDQIKKAVSRFLKPELINRIQDVVIFKVLDRQVMDKIIDKFMKQLNERLSSKDIIVKLHSSAKDFLTKNGFNPEFGARNLLRVIENHIYDPLSQSILDGKIKSGMSVYCHYEDGVMLFKNRSKR